MILHSLLDEKLPIILFFFDGVYPDRAAKKSTKLHRTFGVDRVMPVYFDKGFNELCDDDKYNLVRKGNYVGLRRYRFRGRNLLIVL